MDASYVLPNPPWTYLQIGLMGAVWIVLLIAWLALMCPPFWTLCQQGYRWLWRPVKVRIHRDLLDATVETACDVYRPRPFSEPAAKGQGGSRVMREHQGTVISLAARRGER